MKRNGTAAAFEQGLPAAPELEALLLGDAMCNPDSLAVVRKIESDHWSRPRHRKIREAQLHLADEGVEPTLQLVARHLMDTGQLPDVGMEYLAGLRQVPLTKATAERYAVTIEQKAARARVQQVISAAMLAAQQPHTDNDELADQFDWMGAELRATSKATSGRVRSISDLLPLSKACFDKVEYLDPFRLLPKGTIVGLTGESGGGKSTFIFWLVGRLLERGLSVLYLDRENPPAVIIERCERLGVDGDSPLLRYWGSWQLEEAPQPGSRMVREWSPDVVVVDSAIAFMDEGRDENDSGACRKWFAPIRALASAGCTVVILHHVGKSETAKEYRGSSDFKAALDCGFLLTNWSTDGRLGMIRLTCWKSRFGFSGEINFHYRNGRFEHHDAEVGVTETLSDKFTAILRTNPGIKTSEFEKIGMAQGLSRPQCRSFLENGVLHGSIETRRVGANGRAYYLAKESEQ